MKVGFDAKRAFHNNRGLGNYSRDTIRVLSKFYPQDEYYLFNPILSEKTLFDVPTKCIEINPKSFFYRKLPSLWRSRGMTRDIINCELDIYHGLSQELPININKSSAKTIITVHDAIFVRYPELYSKMYAKIFTAKNRFACKTADHIIAISEQTKRDFVDFFDVSPEKISVVYQGCNNVFREPITEEIKREVRIKYNLPDNFILNVGAIEKRKNLELIIRSLAIGNFDLPLVVVGQPTRYMEEIQTLIRLNNLEKRVLFIHNLPSSYLPALYSMASIFIYPSFFEGFGIPILESLCVGTPVIAATGSCLEETGGASSIYIDPSSPEELNKNISRVLDDTNLRSSMVEAGRMYVEKFSDKCIADNLMGVYRKTLDINT